MSSAVQRNLNRGRTPAAATGISVEGVFIAICLFYMLAFPKGGLKINDIPITIGYLLVVPTMILGVVRGIGRTLASYDIVLLAVCATLTTWSLVCVQLMGGQSTGFLIAYFVSIIVLPLWARMFFNDVIMSNNAAVIENTIAMAIRFVTTYGIFLFFYRSITGQWIEIPYLTINADDLGGLDGKHIFRDGTFKLISTYNNGNIFGVCLSLILPLYASLEKRKYFFIIAILAMMLTLSRTVWIGVFIFLIFNSIERGVSFKNIAITFIGVALSALIILLIMSAIGLNLGFLVDQKLGGRYEQLKYLFDATLIPTKVGVDLSEIVYLSIIRNYGLIGLLLFVAYLAAPIMILWHRGVRMFQQRKASRVMQGLVIYMIIACSDAAFNYIPVMMFYWMIACIGIWYSTPTTQNLNFRPRRITA